MAEYGDVKLTDRQVSGSGVTLLGRKVMNRQDYNPDMQGAQGIAKYERMRRDPEIAGALLRWWAPLFAANWMFEAPKSQPRKLGEDMKELCDRYILGVGRERVSDTFKGGLLPHMALSTHFGVSAVEKVWGVNEKGQQVYARLALIGPQTIYDFKTGDIGELVSLTQRAYVRTQEGSAFKFQEIPDPAIGGTAREKLAVFTYRQEGDDYFGRPPLRECFQAWYHKQELWAIDAQAKEIAGRGLTIIKLPSSVLDPTSDKYQAAVGIVEGLQTLMGAVIGEDWDLQRVWPTGTPPDMMASMRYSDEQIVRAFATEEAHLASAGSGGSRALGETKADTSGLIRQALSDMVEGWVNTQLVPILIERNFGPQEEYPRLQCEDMDAMSGTEAATIAKTLSDAKILRYDRKLEEYFRETNDLPEIDDSTREEPPDPMALLEAQAKAKPPDGTQPGGKPAPAEPDNDTTKPPVSKADAADSPGAAPSRFRREPMAHEAHVQFDAMADYLDTAPAQIWHRVVKPLRDQQVAAIASAAGKATAGQISRGLYPGSDKKPREAKMASELATALLEVYRAGRRTTLNDRARQMAAASKADMTEDDEVEDDEALITPKQRLWIRDIAALFAGLHVKKLIDEATRSGGVGHQANETPQQIEARVMLALQPPPVGRLSQDVAIADLSGAVARSFTTGRVEQAQAIQDGITSIFYSAMMDQNTCGPCEGMDGAELNLDDYDTMVPNPNCEGGDRCRCVPVFVFRPMENQ